MNEKKDNKPLNERRDAISSFDNELRERRQNEEKEKLLKKSPSKSSNIFENNNISNDNDNKLHQNQQQNLNHNQVETQVENDGNLNKNHSLSSRQFPLNNMPGAKILGQKMINKTSGAKTKIAKPKNNDLNLERHKRISDTVKNENYNQENNSDENNNTPSKNNNVKQNDNTSPNSSNNKNNEQNNNEFTNNNSKVNKLKNQKKLLNDMKKAEGKRNIKETLIELFIKFLPGSMLVVIIAFIVLLLLIIMAAISGDADDESTSPGTSSNTLYKSNVCENGIEITGNLAGKYSLEDYVAGVVTAENGQAPEEALKAQAVVARTFALRESNDCQNSLENSTNKQVYTTPSQAAIDAANATAGEVMVNINNNYIPSSFASYPSTPAYAEVWSYGACEAPSCTGNKCDVKLYRLGNTNGNDTGTAFTFSMNVTNNQYKNYLLTNQQGHCYGMSQIGADYLANAGKDYIEILKTFYDFEIEETAEINTASPGDFANWKQKDNRWENKRVLGNQTIGEYGCLATSIVIQIANSKASLSDGFKEKYDELNPGTAIEYMNSFNAFNSGGLMIDVDAGRFVAPKFRLAKSESKIIQKNDIDNLINEGCYPVVSVTGSSVSSTHWVAIDIDKTKQNNDVYIYDPDGINQKLYNSYSSANGYKCYKIT